MSPHRLAFRAIAAAPRPAQATLTGEPIEHPCHGESAEGAGWDDRHCFGGRIVHHRQTLEDAALGRAIKHEVGGPYSVGPLRPQQWLTIGHRDFLPAATPDLQPLGGVDPIDPLVIDAFAGCRSFR